MKTVHSILLQLKLSVHHMRFHEKTDVLPSSLATAAKGARVPSMRKHTKTTENTAARRGAVHNSFHFHTSSGGTIAARVAVISWQLSKTGRIVSSKAGTTEGINKPRLGGHSDVRTFRFRGGVNLIKRTGHYSCFLLKFPTLLSDPLCKHGCRVNARVRHRAKGYSLL
jgi:hypothetical protein